MTSSHTIMAVARTKLHGPPFCQIHTLRKEIIRNSREHASDQLTMHIRQAKISAGVVERESLVIQTKTVHKRGLQIINVNRILCDVKSEIIRRA